MLPVSKIVQQSSASPGSPAAVSASSGFRPVALRPTLSDGLPFSGQPIIVAMVRNLIGQKAAEIGTKGLAEGPNPTPLDPKIYSATIEVLDATFI